MVDLEALVDISYLLMTVEKSQCTPGCTFQQENHPARFQVCIHNNFCQPSLITTMLLTQPIVTTHLLCQECDLEKIEEVQFDKIFNQHLGISQPQ